MPARQTSRPRARRQTSQARPYHHGDLRRVLIDAALQLAAEGARGLRARGRAPGRGIAGRAVPALPQPRRADGGGGRGGAAALSCGDREGAGRGSGRRSARPLPRLRPCLSALGDAQSRTFRDHLHGALFRPWQLRGADARQCRANRPDGADAGRGGGAGPAAVGRPQAHPDRRSRPGLRFCPDESRWPLSALGRGGGGGRADGGRGHRSCSSPGLPSASVARR
ncbi:hypothetical protein ABIF34_005262 [Bradyrhizobium japonicum]